MKTSIINTLLDIATLVNGKLFDMYWEFNLTGSEMKILRYVFNNCLRIYKDLKYFPRGKDGSPRFWRGKERMADDCGVSYPTFRNSIRHLSELGLVTSMDSEEEDTDDLYCVGLSSEFLRGFIKSEQTEKSFRLHNLISLVYDSLTIEILKTKIELDKFPLFSLRENKPCETQGLCKVSNVQNLDETSVEKSSSEKGIENMGANKISRQPIYVERIPIHVKRVPITTVPRILMLQSAQEKLILLKHVRTPFENQVLKVSEYYEYKCRQAIHSTGFKALSKDFRNHKNWKFFVKIFELCRDNDWDYHVYIDAQFDRVRYWNRKQLYPYANQFTSEGAINYYYSYVKDYKEKYSTTGSTKVKTSKTKTINQQIIDEVIKDCENISDFITRSQKRRVNKDLTPEQLKLLYLSDHWISLSASYLSSIPWFQSYLDQFPEEPAIMELKQGIQAIKSSNRLFSLTSEIVLKVEQQMNIPKTLCG